MIETYTSLHVHSEYSNASCRFTDCINNVKDIVKWSYENGLRGVAISDHQSVSGYVDLEQTYNSIEKDRPFTHIFANEFYLISSADDQARTETDDKLEYYHFMVYVKDKIGLKQMYELSSKAWLRCYTYRGLIRRPSYYEDFEEVIGEDKGHLMCSTACLGGLLPKAILAQDEETTDKFINWCCDTFGKENFFLECQPCHEDNEEQITVNKTLWDIHSRTGAGIIVTTDAHYMRPEDRETHEVFLRSKDGGDDREVGKFYATTYMFTPSELRDMLHNTFNDEQIDTMFATTNEIADRIEPIKIEAKTRVPALPSIPEHEIKHYYKDYYDKYENINYYANSTNDHETYYYSEVEKGLYKYSQTHKIDLEKYLKEIDWEFSQVKGLGEIFDGECMADYFTVVQKIVELIWTVGDSYVGIGRGSAGSYVTNFLLGITGINPLLEENEEYFPPWRFCSTARSNSLFDCDIDIQSFKKEQIIKAVKDYFGWKRVCQVVTWGRLTSKTALERAGKGLGIPDDTVGYLKSLIPVKRGAIYSLNDCLHGNPKKEREKSESFIKAISDYPQLLNIALKFEGLVITSGVHAGALNIIKTEYSDTGAYMVSASGAVTSQFDLHQAEYASDLKMDLLSIDALENLRACMNILLDDGLIEWQGSLRDTYNKYLGWDSLNFDDEEMWNLLPTMLNAFQYDSPVGRKALKQIGAKNLDELTLANGLMRLAVPSGEQPMEKYVRYRNDINEWYKDMTEYGLNEKEQEICKRLLGRFNGMCVSQETMMVSLMDKEVCGFTLKQADKARKAVAKKSADALAETEKDIYECGRKCGNRDIFLDYWWKVQIEMSKSYAFAACHSREYSTECLQEMNLYRFFPKAYWNTAVITTQAQSDDERENTNGSINYGKIAQSIYKAKNNGVMVYPPDVNEAKLSFSVSADKEKILYGLSGISGINNDIANQIIANRPYDSFEDFLDKNLYKGSLITATKIKTLIFGGCFDCFNPDRVKIMKEYIAHEAPAVDTLTMANMPSIKGCGVSIPKEIVAPYNFYKYTTAKERLYGAHPTAKSKKLYWLDDKSKAYFTKNLMPQLKEDVDYWYEDDKLIVVDKSIEKSLKVSLDRLKGYINDPSFLKEYRRAIMRQKYMDFIDGNESVEHWSFTALSYYSHNHELYNLDYDKYLLTKFCELPEEPNFVEMSTRGRTWRRYEINAICGTVLDVNKNKHIVTILTPEDDVVNCKFNAEHFAYYTRQITDGDYTEKPWLKRGNLVILTGYRRGENEFAVKRYKNTVYNSSVKLIHSVNSDGSAVLQSKRYGEEEDEKM